MTDAQDWAEAFDVELDASGLNCPLPLHRNRCRVATRLPRIRATGGP